MLLQFWQLQCYRDKFYENQKTRQLLNFYPYCRGLAILSSFMYILAQINWIRHILGHNKSTYVAGLPFIGYLCTIKYLLHYMSTTVLYQFFDRIWHRIIQILTVYNFFFHLNATAELWPQWVYVSWYSPFLSVCAYWPQLLNQIQFRQRTRSVQDTYSFLLEKLGHHLWCVTWCNVFWNIPDPAGKILVIPGTILLCNTLICYGKSHHSVNRVQRTKTMVAETTFMLATLALNQENVFVTE